MQSFFLSFTPNFVYSINFYSYSHLSFHLSSRSSYSLSLLFSYFRVVGSLGKSLRITDPPAPGRGTGAGASKGKSSGVKFGINPTQVPAPESVLGESKYAYGVSDVRAAYVPSTVCSEELSIRLSTTPFTRMVFVFRYEDDDALTAISDAISRVNTRSMPDIQGQKHRILIIHFYFFTSW